MKNIKPILNKIKKFMEIIVVSNEFDEAYKGILLCSEKTKAYKQPFGCLLLSKGGLGKTTICRTIVKENKPFYRSDNYFKKHIIPVFYIEIPSPVTVKSVASCMLQALNDPAPFLGNTAELNYRLVTLLRECETKLIFMDEFHHLFDLQTSTKKMNKVVCNWIKTLVNETNICFCLVGLPEFESLLKVDSQLARRFSKTFILNPLRIDKVNECGTLHLFLMQISKNVEYFLNIRFDPPLNNALLSLQIYIATSGYHAYLMLLIESCIYQVVNNEQDIITTDHFSVAWEEGVTAYVSRIKANPFKLDMATLSTALRG